MTEQLGRPTREFFVTTPSPCPYLPGRTERKVFTFLGGPNATAHNDALTRRGFRRSQNIIYIPACDTCASCVPVRIPTAEFQPSVSQKRNLKRNADLVRVQRPAKATREQFSILRAYLDERHAQGGMADMTILDYAAMVEETSVETVIFEYRIGAEDGPLAAVALTDQLCDGVSMVYSFFDPDFNPRSLGTYMILDHIGQTDTSRSSYVYLGYWVAGSRKMGYKARFQPIEALSRHGWERFEPNQR